MGSNRYFRLSVVDANQGVLNQDYRRFAVYQTTDVPMRTGELLTILGVKPNPAAREAEFSCIVPSAMQVAVDVYDTAGRQVRALAREWQTTGIWKLVWDGRDDSCRPVASGMYFIRLHTGSPAQPAVARVVWLQ